MTKVSSESQRLTTRVRPLLHEIYTLTMANTRTYTLRVVFDRTQLEKLRSVSLPLFDIELSLDFS